MSLAPSLPGLYNRKLEIRKYRKFTSLLLRPGRRFWLYFCTRYKPIWGKYSLFPKKIGLNYRKLVNQIFNLNQILYELAYNLFAKKIELLFPAFKKLVTWNFDGTKTERFSQTYIQKWCCYLIPDRSVQKWDIFFGSPCSIIT